MSIPNGNHRTATSKVNSANFNEADVIVNVYLKPLIGSLARRLNRIRKRMLKPIKKSNRC